LLRQSSSGEYSENAKYLIARSYFMQNNFDQAIRVYKEFLRQYPQSELQPRVHYEIGDSYYNKHDFQQAMNWYEQVISRFPDSPLTGEAISGLQWSAMQLGQVEKAFRVADRYIEKNPKSQLSQELLLRRGDFYFGQNQYEQAIKAYQNFLKKYPGSLMAPKAQYWIGLSYLNLKQTGEAKAAFNRVIQHYPDSDVVPDALFQLGIIARQKNDLKNSLLYFDEILKGRFARGQDDSFVSEVYYQRGLTLLKKGERLAAQAAFKKSIEVQSSSFSSYQARIQLARILASENKIEEAQKLLNLVIQDRNDELAAQAQKVLGDAYFNAGQYQKALTNYLRVKYVYQAYPSWVARALFAAGMCYEKLKQTEQARKVYKELVEKFPTERITNKAKERLAGL